MISKVGGLLTLPIAVEGWARQDSLQIRRIKPYSDQVSTMRGIGLASGRSRVRVAGK